MQHFVIMNVENVRSGASATASSGDRNSQGAGTATQPPRAPRSLREADVVIVGGGPTGSAAAALLHARGVHTTLIEKQESFLKFRMAWAYSMGLTPRGSNTLSCAPGLREQVLANGTQRRFFQIVKAGCEVKKIEIPHHSDGPGYMFMRHRLSHALRQFVEQNTTTTAMYGTEVKNILFHPDGYMDLIVQSEDTGSSSSQSETIRSRFLLACDGRHSKVVRALNDARDSAVHSTRGFEIHEKMSPSVGLRAKSIALQHDNIFAALEDADASLSNLTMISGVAQRANRRFNLTIFPMLAADAELLGSVLGITARPPDSPLWNLRSVDEAYNLFAENFPQFDVRSIITVDAMRNFIESCALEFPPVSRTASLAAVIGDHEKLNGGVVILGDAAHCFPPDIGQGVNSALEDVAILMRTIDEAPPEASIGYIARTYEAAREADTNALMDIARLASPYQYGQSQIGLLLHAFNVAFRGKLSKLLPQLFHPALSQLLRLQRDLTYSETMRRANVTTTRIYVALIIFLIAPSIFLFLVTSRGSSLQ